MHTDMNPHTHPTSQLSQKLASLQPKKRNSDQAKFADHYDAIIDAIHRGVSLKDIREALAEDGIKVSSVTFKRLLDAEAKRRTEVTADVTARTINPGPKA
jgi:hypothetical protein